MDFAEITGAVAVGAVSLGIIAMGAIKIVPNVASWGTKKLVGFFR